MNYLSKIWPHLCVYLKTNRYTGILLLVLAAAFLLGRSREIRDGLDKISANPRRNLIVLAAMILFGVVLRLGWLSICEYRPAFEWPASTTEVKVLTEYDQINITASDITRGVWFRDAQGQALVRRPIGYPVFLALFYKLFGRSYAVVYALQLFLFAATVVLIFLLASQAFDARVGLLAAFLFTIYPLSIYSIVLTLDEHLFLPLWYFGLYLLFREIKQRPVPWSWLWYGVIFGYAAMTRTHAIFMPLVVALVFIRLKYRWKKIFLSVLAVFFVGQLINLPWVMRNLREFDAPIFYLAGNHYLYFTNNPQAFVTREHYDMQRYPHPGEQGYSEKVRRLELAINANDWKVVQCLGAELTREWILSHPGDFLTLGTQKVLHFFSPDRSRGLWAIDLVSEATKLTPDKQLKPSLRMAAEDWAYGFYYAVLYLFFLGVGRTRAVRRQLSAIQKNSLFCFGLCFLFYAGLHFVMYPERKYRFPLEPLMIIFAASFLVFLVRDLSFGARKGRHDAM